MSFTAESGRVIITKPGGAVTFDTNQPMLLPLQRFTGSITVPGRSGSTGGINQVLTYLVSSSVLPQVQLVTGSIRGTNSVFSVDWLNVDGTAVYYSYWVSSETVPKAELSVTKRLEAGSLYLDVKLFSTYFWQFPANTIEYKLLGHGFTA